MSSTENANTQAALSEFVAAKAAEFGIPGAAVGVRIDGREFYACHGVTSVAHPLPVDERTLFVLGSVTKAHTATALMRLVAEGRVELEAPVRRYVPELVLADERVAAEITVMQLLNHTAGLDWNLVTDTGEGDDALEGFVAELAALPLIGEPGARASYSQAGFNVVGRIIENATGLTYEQALTRLVLQPMGLSDSLFFAGDVVTRRFAVGHNPDEDGTPAVAGMWKGKRCDNPGGGLVSSVADQLRAARFHLGDGLGEGGERILPAELLARMQEPSVELRGSTLGDAFGIGWFLRDVDGVRTVGHGGSVDGQFSELLIAPGRDFAVVSLANHAYGYLFNQAVARWALEHCLGVVDRDPEPLPYDPARAPELAGRYDNDAMTLVIAADGEGLTLAVAIKPEIRAASDSEMPADYPAESMGLLPGEGDEYIVTSGGLKGQRGFFTRDAGGAVVGIDLAGRFFGRVPAASM
ncbi:serine hydrolase domain-containing protein [Streptomyces sp. NPDC090045]|uniref:serine hydrolase domain-containing protein n=1 Tax=Streptomyces sp. NPDC090045 TaxID=3365927 RepID=UPI00380245C1